MQTDLKWEYIFLFSDFCLCLPLVSILVNALSWEDPGSILVQNLLNSDNTPLFPRKSGQLLTKQLLNHCPIFSQYHLFLSCPLKINIRVIREKRSAFETQMEGSKCYDVSTDSSPYSNIQI